MSGSFWEHWRCWQWESLILILGKDAIFVYHDQLDGEVIAYLLQARHLWDGAVFCRNL